MKKNNNKYMEKKNTLKKRLVLSISLLFVVASAAPSLSSIETTDNMSNSYRNYANVIIVDDEGDGNYTDIQDAIDNAIGGDTIQVYSGTYTKAVVNKQLILEGIAEEYGSGSDTGKPVIDAGGGSYTKGVDVQADEVTITGFHIKNAGDIPFGGIYVYNHDMITITYNDETVEIYE